MSSAGGKAIGITRALAGERLLITGATGFVGKVLVEKLLWAVPEVGKLLLLIRPGGGRSAAERLAEEILAAPIMARLRALHGSGWEEWAAGKVEAISGELSEAHFGLDEGVYNALCRRVDRVVASAASVTFDERLDRALAANARGALCSLELARDAGNAPLLHISTCFVSGRRQGLIAERVESLATIEPKEVLAALDEASAKLAATGKPGDDRAWVDAGAEQAERFGFNDIYTLTKALAERLLERDRGGVPLAIVRPAIVESAAVEPIPGWIEAVRVADPMLVAYGRGRTDTLPGSPEIPFELIPVDYVVHALIAALAALPKKGEAPDGTAGSADPLPVYQIGSSRNPITLGELFEHARQGFESTPLRDENGEPIAVGEVRFAEPETYRRGRIAQREKLRKLARWLPRKLGAAKKRELRSGERALDHLIHLLSVYRPYLERGARYDDANTQQLWQSLSPADQSAFPFDIGALDWASYIAGIHVPGLIRFALRAESGAPPPETERESSEAILARAIEHAASARTLFELFAKTAAAYPQVMAFQTFRQGTWLRYTYAQALTATTNLAARLSQQYGIGHGDRVVLWASGSPEWVLATLAIQRLGAVSVPLDPQWPADEVREAARLVEAKLICAAPRLLEASPEQSSGEGDLACAIVALAEPFVPSPDVRLLPGNEPGACGSASDLASILFTSGTTVAPKAVPLTHGNYLANVRDLLPLMQLTRERLLSVLPMHHVFEQMVGLFVPMAGGSTISYVAEIKPAEISWMMSTTQPTVLVAVPRLLELLHGGIERSVEAGGAKLKLIFRILFALSRRKDGANGPKLFSKVHQRFGGSLRRIASGGSALDPQLGRSFQLMGFKVAEGYGMTETSPVLTVNPWDAIRFGSVGRPLPGVEIELREPQEAAPGLEPSAGEVWVRGANVMSGYYQNPSATAAVMDGGWLNTGDIGFFDDDGYLHLSGRTKDVIVTSAGKNIYPEEVEARYRDLPGVAELVILGLPSAGAGGSGERVTALVVPETGASEEAIRAAVAERSKQVPSYQQVVGIELWNGELPKTTTMKVKRTVLRDAVKAGERGTGSAPPSPAAAPVKTHTPAQMAVIEALARLTHTRPDLLHPEDRLADLGVDSLTRVELIGELEARFDRRLSDAEAAQLERVEDLFELGR